MSSEPISQLRTSEATLDRFAASRDLWPGGTLDAWQGRPAPMPACVVWPEDAGQVEEALAQAQRDGRVVVPYGAGSGVSGGARGVAGSVVLDTKALQGIGPLDADALTVRCQAGVNGQHLEDWLQARGFTLGHSPSSIWCSTVGGWAAARGAGQFSSYYGVFEDMVLGLTFVTPEKGIVEVGAPEGEHGHWLDQILGSEGRLGVITDLTLRVRPVPARRWLRGYRFDGVASALDAMRRLMQAELWPSVVRLYDPVDTRIGGKTKPKKEGGEHGFVRRWLKRVEELPGVRRRTLALPLGLPGVVNHVFDRLASGCLLVVGFEGDSDLVEACLPAATDILREAGGEDLGEDPGRRWFDSRHAVSFKLMPVFERGGFADTMEVAAPWSRVEGLYEAVRAAVRPHALVMAHMSHVYPEGACIYFSFAGRGDRAVYDRLWADAQRAVLAAGGTVSHHHGVGQLKARAASVELGAAAAGYRELAEELDPQQVCNPGRVVVDVGPVEAPLPWALEPRDGMLRVAVESSLEARQQLATDQGVELMWPFEDVLGPERWVRSRWQQPYTEVSATVEGRRCVLGRGPRSASGPDLRRWLARHDGAVAAVPTVPLGERWCGRASVEAPWRSAIALLRGGLRPAILTVDDDGALLVGFRGPAASALGAVAAERLGVEVEPVDYVPHPLPSGPLVLCAPDDPDVVAVCEQGALRRAEVTP